MCHNRTLPSVLISEQFINKARFVNGLLGIGGPIKGPQDVEYKS